MEDLILVCQNGMSKEKYTTINNFLSKKDFITIKANLYHKTEKLIFHKPHLDYDFKHKGAILYLNTCNGYTVLNGGVKIKSVENTLLLFDSSKTHNSTNCTDKKIRVNININYF